MAGDDAERALIERLLAQPIADATRAVWRFTNRTTSSPSAPGIGWSHRATGIRASNFGADPPRVIFDALPGVPVSEAGDAGLEGQRFTLLPRSMGELPVADRLRSTLRQQPSRLRTGPQEAA